MENVSQDTTSGNLWYQNRHAVRHLFCGVFEGGGAKGVAYAGALQALKEKNCWFQAVAGASAGAITAALVASGVGPEQMERLTQDALKTIQSGKWKGMLRLRRTTGFLNSDNLRAWIENLLKEQLQEICGTCPDDDVTFQELFDATGIELNVVCADLSLKRQMIFSHHETPKCSVANAVVASSSIPFAFASNLLLVPSNDTDDTYYHHTLVDGGVWSNFPLFVFENRNFRTLYQRKPEQLDQDLILGFMLQEAEAPPPVTRGDDIRFDRTLSLMSKGGEIRFDRITLPRTLSFKGLRAREWRPNEGLRPRSPSFGERVGAWFLFPLALLGRFAEWNAGIEPGRWPRPRSPLVKHLVEFVNGTAGGVYKLMLAVSVSTLAVVGGWIFVRRVTISLGTVLPSHDFSSWSEYIPVLISLAMFLLVSVSVILLALATVLGIIANLFVLRAARRILYGLLTTYMAGAGAPAWTEEHPNVIALPIPETVTTLSFNMTNTERRNIIDDAQRVTEQRLPEILEKLLP